MQRIVVLNPKGGSGKTTIAVNLASWFAAHRHKPVIIDMDPQGSSQRWIGKRPAQLPPIGIVAGAERDARTTRSFQLRVPPDTTHVIVDTPAAIDSQRMPEVIRGADKILVPVLPSDIDIHAASRCIRDLLLIAKVKREENRLGVIANRVRRHTSAYDSLQRFLQSLGIPIVATFNDSQNYLRAAEMGVGLHELRSYVARNDMEQWDPLVEWLAGPPYFLPSSSSKECFTLSAQLL